MSESLITLMQSKRVLVAVVTIVVDVAVVFGLDLDAAKVETLLTTINTLALALIGGISVSDHGKAMGQPAGVDHKGRGIPSNDEDAQPEDDEPNEDGDAGDSDEAAAP